MEFSQYLALIKKKKAVIFSIVIIFVIIALIITFIQPFQYAAKSKVLVVQNYTQGVDPYQVSRANEYVSDVLAKVISSNSFFNEVLNAGFNINRNYFPQDVNKQLKKWRETVSAQAESRGGIISIAAYHQDSYQADQIVRAVIAVLKSKHAFYHGAGDQVSIKTIDQPFTTSLPVKPNIALNMALAVVCGFIFSLSYIYILPEKKYNLSLWPRRKKKKIRPESLAEETGPVYSQDAKEYAETDKNSNKERIGYDDIAIKGSMTNVVSQ